MRTDVTHSGRFRYARFRYGLHRLRPRDYSGLVRRLRVVLPITAVVLLAGVAIWPHFDPAQAPKQHVEAKAPEMHNPKFSGVDSGNQPYTITSDSAVQKTNGSNDMDLVKPLADIRLKNGAWIAVRGDSGQYREQSGLITLEGHVTLYHDSGYEVETSAAAIDLDKGISYSDLPTHVQGPRGEIDGEGFRLYQDSDRVVFTGKSRLVLKSVEDQVAPTPSAQDTTTP